MPLTFLYTDTGGSPQQLVVDASLSERKSTKVQITEHPVEEGANISDHVRRLPTAWDVEGLLVDFPLEDGGRGGFDFAASLRQADGDGRAGALYAQLEALQETATLLEVHSGRGVLADMVIENLTETRTVREGRGAVRFQASLRNLRIVSSQTVPLKKSAIPSGQGKLTGGKKNGETPTDSQKQQTRSLAVQALQGVGWLK